MNRHNGLLGVLLIAQCFLACTTATLSIAHVPKPAIQSSPCAELLIVSVPTEGRPLQGRSELGRSFIGMLPLVPYGHQELTPEYLRRGEGIRYSLLEDLSEVIARDLQAAGVASVVAVDHGVAAAVREDAHVLKLNLTEGIWHRNITLYGLSLAGVAVWLFAPVSYGSAELGFDAELFAPGSKHVGSSSFKSTKAVREWLWSLSPGRAFLRRLPATFDEMAPALRAFVAGSLRGSCTGPPAA